ncbi:MAG: ATP-binding protein [Desulfovibrio sp.]
MEKLKKLLNENEFWLMEKILSYAKKQEYTPYTSTLLEAWKVSIQGLTQAIMTAIQAYGSTFPEFSPEDRFAENPVARFGVIEAKRHRQRGISIQMFLGLYKYYRYSYTDLLRNQEPLLEKTDHYIKFVERCFDLIEIAFSAEWSGLSADSAILELQKTNRKMTNEKNKYLTLFESLNYPVFLINTNGELQNTNQHGVFLLGQDADETIRHYTSDEAPWGNIKLGDAIPWLQDSLSEFIQSENTSQVLELSVNGPGKNTYRINFTRMRDVSLKFKGGIVTIEDITQSKKLEEELTRVRNLKSIGQLAAGVAHEINTPLQFIENNLVYITSALSVIRHSEEDADFHCEEVKTAIEESLSGIRHIESITLALKEFAYPNYTDPVILNINNSITNVIFITQNQWKHVAKFEEDLNASSLISAIPGDVNQILINLVQNAIHAIEANPKKEKGLILIQSHDEGNQVVITVRDNGCGIPEDNIRMIFNPFFTTKEIGDGQGQGLAITHGLVAKHKGKISVESTIGIGTTFSITFPAVQNSQRI